MEIIDSSYDVARWKAVLKDPEMVVTYSTDEYGLIIFRSSEIAAIYFSKEDVEESMTHDS